MASLVLEIGRKMPPGLCRLTVRENGPDGPEYDGLLMVPVDLARDIVASKTGVVFEGIYPTGRRAPVPGGIVVTPLKDPQSNGDGWCLSVERTDGDVKIATIGDATLRKIMATDTKIAFPEGPPDWDDAKERALRRRIDALRAEADRLESALSPVQRPMKSTQIDLEAIIRRIAGTEDYQWCTPSLKLPGGERLYAFDLEESSLMNGELPDQLHLITDGAGGYRVMPPDASAPLREGHLSDFVEEGFRAAFAVEIEIDSYAAFDVAFGFNPHEKPGMEAIARFLSAEHSIAPHIEIERAEVHPLSVDRIEIRCLATVADEAGFMHELAKHYRDIWAGLDGLSFERAGALYEALVASNDTPSPDLCGYQIHDFRPIAIDEFDRPEPDSAPEMEI